MVQRTTALAFASVLLLASACADERQPGSGPSPTGGAGNDAPTGQPPGTTTSGSGGGADGGGGEVPVVAACSGDHAFQADEVVFDAPTPTGLGSALQAWASKPGSHPITVVLLNDGESATIGASFAAALDDDVSFDDNLWPSFADAEVDDDTFGTLAPASLAYLRVRHGSGVLDIPLEGVDISATTDFDCAVASVTVAGTIPAAMRDESIDDGEAATTIGELAGGEPDSDIPVSLSFEAISIAFDFGSMESGE
jgi:hypothetical protein